MGFVFWFWLEGWRVGRFGVNGLGVILLQSHAGFRTTLESRTQTLIPQSVVNVPLETYAGKLALAVHPCRVDRVCGQQFRAWGSGFEVRGQSRVGVGGRDVGGLGCG